MGYEGGENKNRQAEEDVSPNWSQWFRRQDPKVLKDAIAPATEAENQWNTTKERFQLTSQEKKLQDQIETTDDLQKYVSELIQRSHSRKRHALQENAASLQRFAASYSPIIEALTEASPFGAGKAIWRSVSLLFTIIATKSGMEYLMSQFLVDLSRSLPRLHAYREIYPTIRMVEMIAELHASIIHALEGMVSYYKRTSWAGSVKRFFGAAAGVSDTIQGSLSDVDRLSREILNEGFVGMSAELRSTRETVEATGKELNEVRAELKQTTCNVVSLQEKIKTRDLIECRKQAASIKTFFVPEPYDAHQIVAAARAQLRSSGGLKANQKQAHEYVMSSDEVQRWLEQPNTQLTRKPSRSEQRLLWLYSHRTPDTAISSITLELLDRNRNHLVLHSMHQTLHQQTIHKSDRTASSILGEAIYQVLAHDPTLVQNNDNLQAFWRSAQNLDFIDLCSLLGSLLESSNPASSSSSTPETCDLSEITWIIDRVDKCRFRGSGATRLTDFVRALQEIVVQCKGRLRVVFVSTHSPLSIDSTWKEDYIAIRTEDDEDDELELKATWMEHWYQLR